MSISSMSHVHFKKKPCHPVEFKGQGPSADKVLVIYGCGDGSDLGGRVRAERRPGGSDLQTTLR